tara:strand:- start:82370 stop:83428 length:1059 start_codon:yes stop_codon:yes gene_type:complete
MNMTARLHRKCFATLPSVLASLCFGLVGCSDDPANEGADAAPEVVVADGAVDDPISTATTLCALSESGQQQLVYTQGGGPSGAQTDIDETLDYSFSWACDAEFRTLTGNGVPNHAVTGGVFATQLSQQNISQTFPIEPARVGETTAVTEPGYALNSIKFDPGTAGTCPDDATDDSDCNYAMGSDQWGMVATPGAVSPWKFSFGVDENDAHVQPNGQYHYHGTPVGLVASLNPNADTSMTLVGWAADGFPMYSVKGYADANDATSQVVSMQSSYQTIATPPSDRPNVTDFPLGHFTQDWEYAPGSGDLDECNGRFGVTPEFPDGIYHYYITETYPFVQRCVKGTSLGGGPGGP